MYTNKLIGEKSPYLLQHAHNPVNWWPWGQEAFDEARRENKPIFLSVGYSTCHWCHVMERESFESEETAALLNRSFISIKVDREERPDIDRIYMTFVQATTGGGGWPMSVWLTPALKPFYGGTYFPPANAFGRPGFLSQILQKIAEAWSTDQARILESSDKVTEQLRKAVSPTGGRGTVIDDGVLESAFNVFRRSFDSKLGGFGNAPKFPRPVTHNFLLRFYARTGNQEALEMVLKTLREMAAGGMNDQLGGGFHRYSVDERWFVPHFEKMLYDQAQLAVSYLEAYQITREPFYAGVARDIFEYVLRDMTAPGGAFYSAEDADSVIDPARPSEKGEGAFYIWSRAEIDEIVGAPAADWFSFRHGAESDGNVRNDPQGEFTGRNILYEARSIVDTARQFGAGVDEVREALDDASAKLMAARAKRVRPHLDDKVLTSWNGLMISAFALGSQVLDEPRYLDAARGATTFLLENMCDQSTGELLRRHREGENAIAGFLDDYSFFLNGLVDLYEASFDVRYIDAAVRVAERMIERFTDAEHGAFFSTASGDPSLLLRMKDDYDGAEPSGNSMAVLALLRLAQFTDRAEFREAAERALDAFGPNLQATPVTAPQMLVAAEYARSKPKQIVLAGESPEFLREIWSRFIPNRAVMRVDEGMAKHLPVMEEMKPVDGQPTAYVCENYACQLPVTEKEKLRELLQ